MRGLALAALAAAVIITISVTTISAQQYVDIPDWVKGVANFWVEGNISDAEFAESISFLIEQKIIQIEMQEADDHDKNNAIRELQAENKKLEAENKKLKQEISELETKLGTLETQKDSDDDSENVDYGCTADNPHRWSDGYCYTIPESTYEEPDYSYDEPEETTPECDSSYPTICVAPYPPDLDCDEIPYSNFSVPGYDPHGFDDDYDGIGCEVGSPDEPVQESPTPSCDPSYPDVCIAPYPPDLDCGEIPYKNFQVVGSDPHGFDRDNDGIGCES